MGRGRAAALIKADPSMALVLALGLAVRAALIPLDHGQDFVVWRKASAAVLRGVNIYAHHPHYPGGPYAYFPLFLYLELPFRWLAWHAWVPFTDLGKLPILAADVACAVLIRNALRRHGVRRPLAALGGGLYLLNPLVLYNSAYYGRFDSLGCALLLVALSRHSRQDTTAEARPLWFGLAIAAKTFPGFLLPGVLHHAGRPRWHIVAGAVAVLAAVSLPFLVTPDPFIHDLVLWDVTKAPSGISWQYLLSAPLGARAARLLSYGLLLVFAAGAVWLRKLPDVWWYVTLTLIGFVLCSKLVLEQYLTWPMPWLILIGLTARDRAGRSCLAVLAVFTVLGVIDNESFHPLGRSAWPVALALALAAVVHLTIGLRAQRGLIVGGRPVGDLAGGITGPAGQREHR